MTNITRVAATAAAAFVIAASGQPGHAKTIKMTAVGGAPPIVTYVKVTKEHFIPEVNRRLAASGKDFKIEWTEAYAQTLAKFTEVLETVEEGIAHLGLVLKHFEPSSLPLGQHTYLIPFAKHDLKQMIAIDRNMRKKVPQMNEAYLKHNQVFLTSAANLSMHMFTTFPVRRFEDLKGHKLGASGTMGHWLRGTGAVIVNSSMAASFTSIKNGLYDGYTIGVTLAFPYKTYEAAPYMTEVHFGVTNTPTLTVNKDTWDSFPRFVKKIFRDVAVEWANKQDTVNLARDGKFRGIMKKKGVKFAGFSTAERRRWAMSMPNIAHEWASSLERKGKPGRAVLKAYMDELRALNVEIARHWDRE